MSKISKKNERIGKSMINQYGSTYTIIDYIDTKNIVVQFDNGYIKETEYKEFINGSIKSPYCKSVYGNGYIGEGKYKVIDLENKKATIQYQYWHDMIKRSFDLKLKEKRPSYKDITCCNEWLSFQTFAKWFDENYYTVDDERIHLDKDILYKGNKIYSPETCIFVPARINELFTQQPKSKYGLPTGVDKLPSGKFRVRIATHGNNLNKHFGVYDVLDEAINSYKINKKDYIITIANLYKDKIPLKLFIAMSKYEV